MDAELAGLLELILIFGIVLALGVWELVSLRRTMRRADKRMRDKESGDPRS